MWKHLEEGISILCGIIFIGGFWIAIFLFAGTPDLMDAIIFKLTNGQLK